MARHNHEDTEEETASVLRPKCNEHLKGHQKQEKQLLAMINGHRLPHAFLFTGQRGIGKATLAYRLARFLLAEQKDSGNSLFGDPLPAESLYIPSNHPTFKRVVSGGHPDLLVLEGDDIKIEEARKVSEFLALTPAESNWRVVIIDCAEAMNRNAANALLKILEEPPSQAVLVLISHNPGQLLPTIRSRCRVLRLSSLGETEFADIVAGAMPQLQAYDYSKWALLSGFSPGVALTLMEGQADALYKELLENVTSKDTVRLHSFAERFARKDAEAQWQVLKRLVFWLITRIASSPAGIGQEVFPGEMETLMRLHASKPYYFWTELWEKTGSIFAETENLYLDRKQAMITLMRGMG